MTMALHKAAVAAEMAAAESYCLLQDSRNVDTAEGAMYAVVCLRAEKAAVKAIHLHCRPPPAGGTFACSRLSVSGSLLSVFRCS